MFVAAHCALDQDRFDVGGASFLDEIIVFVFCRPSFPSYTSYYRMSLLS
jgi:hypothetical protein